MSASEQNGHAKQDPGVGKFLIPGKRLSANSLADYYSRNAEEAGKNFDANDWAEAEQMYAQFDFLIQHVDLNGKTLLDVGAGNGLLYQFLEERGIRPQS